MPLNWADTNNILKIPVTFTFYNFYNEFQWNPDGLYDALTGVTRTAPKINQIDGNNNIDGSADSVNRGNMPQVNPMNDVTGF